MAGFDYTSLGKTPPEPDKDPKAKPPPDLNFEIVKAELEFKGYGPEAQPEGAASKILARNPSLKQRFLFWAEESGYSSAENAAEIATLYSTRPDILERLTDLLAGAKRKITNPISDFYFAISLSRPEGFEGVSILLDGLKGETEPQIMIGVSGVIRAELRRYLATPITVENVRDARDICTRFHAYRGVDAYFNDHKLEEMRVVLECSKEPKHDLELVSDPGGSPVYKRTAQQLREFYRQGHNYIYHSEAFGPPEYKKEPTDPAELALRKAISQQPHYPPLKDQDALVKDILSVPAAAREAVVKMTSRFLEHNLDLRVLATFVEVLRRYGGNEGVYQVADILTSYNEKEIPIAVGIFEEFAPRLSKPNPSVVERFRDCDLAGLENELYAVSLQEHQSKFPERPLAEVRADFLRPEFPDSEVPKIETLDRAVAMYENIQRRGQELITKSGSAVRVALQELVANREKIGPEEFRAEFFAHSRELFKRQFGVYPYNVQMLALLLLTDPNPIGEGEKGRYAQIKTGEGKSLIIANLTLYEAALASRPDNITANGYLAERDALRFAGYFKNCGFDCAAFHHHSAEEKVQSGTEILYTTTDDLIGRYLTCRLNNRKFFDGNRFDVALVDEADNLCIDLGRDLLRIAPEAPPRFTKDALIKILHFVDTTGAETISGNFLLSVASLQEAVPEARELHPVIAALYLRSAVHSADVVKGEDFIIDDKKQVVVVDVDNTGRLRPKLHWSHGLHEFVAIRNGAELPHSVGTAAEMSHAHYLQRYRKLLCISGTMGDETDRAELRELYGLRGFDVPPYRPSKREDYPATLIKGTEPWMRAITRWAEELTKGRTPRPLLIIASSVAESTQIYEELRRVGFTPQLLNDNTNFGSDGSRLPEQDIIDRAGIAGQITVATMVAARGADIVPDAEAKKNGGLHALLTFLPVNFRVEYQARGRAGRQGDPGSSDIVACMDTDRFVRQLPDVARELLEAAVTKYGPNSEEIQGLINFLRRSNNIIGSSFRRSMLERTAVAEQGMELYFSGVSGVVKELESKNSTFRSHRYHEAASWVVSLYLSRTWSRAFDDFDTLLNNSGINQSNPDGPGTAAPGIIAKFRDAFQRSFGVEMESAGFLWGNELSPELVRLVEGYVNQAIVIQDRSSGMDQEKVKLLLAMLSVQVTDMMQDCFRKFEKVSGHELEEFVRERMRKQESDDGESD